MKLSAQISTFIVLVVAIIGIGIYVNTTDIDTDVRTAERTLLPNTFTADGDAQVAGLSFRYPQSWRVTVQENSFLLSIPKEVGNREAGNHVFIINVEQKEGNTPLDPIAQIPPADPGASDSVGVVENSPFPAARSVAVLNGDVSVYQAERLTDDNLFLTITNQTPIPENDWNDLLADFDRTINSLTTDNVRFIPDALSFEVPNTWVIVDDNALGFSATTPADTTLSAPDVVLQLTINEATPLFDGLSNLAIQFGLTPPPDATTPLDVMQAFEGYEGDVVQISEPLKAVNYVGFDGLELGFVANTTDQRVAVLDTEDGFYLLVLTQIVSADGFDAFKDDIQSILDSVKYNTPDPILIEKAKQQQAAQQDGQ